MALLALPVAGCSSETTKEQEENGADTAGADAGQDAAVENDERLVITADWLNKSLSFIDLDALLAGASSREEVLVESVDLSAYSPGPLEVQTTPDGKTALVTVSAGFFAIPLSNLLVGVAETIPNDPGKLLFIDLDSMQVVDEVDTGHGPMGIGITPDGTRAFVPHFGSNHVAVVDVVGRQLLEQVEVGPFSEEIALDDTGSVGVFSYSAAGNFRSFGTDDMEGTLSPEVQLTGDAAGVAFFPGTKTAFLVQAPNVLASEPSAGYAGYNIVDVSDPQAPTILEEVRFDTEFVIQYPAVAVRGRGTVIVPVVMNGTLSLREYALRGETVAVERSIEVAPSTALFGAFVVAVAKQRYAICALPGERALSVTDLDTEHSFTVSWLPDAGPAGVAIR